MGDGVQGVGDPGLRQPAHARHVGGQVVELFVIGLDDMIGHLVGGPFQVADSNLIPSGGAAQPNFISGPASDARLLSPCEGSETVS